MKFFELKQNDTPILCIILTIYILNLIHHNTFLF